MPTINDGKEGNGDHKVHVFSNKKIIIIKQTQFNNVLLGMCNYIRYIALIIT